MTNFNVIFFQAKKTGGGEGVTIHIPEVDSDVFEPNTWPEYRPNTDLIQGFGDYFSAPSALQRTPTPTLPSTITSTLATTLPPTPLTPTMPVGSASNILEYIIKDSGIEKETPTSPQLLLTPPPPNMSPRTSPPRTATTSASTMARNKREAVAFESVSLIQRQREILGKFIRYIMSLFHVYF